jgi:hypothetical protein
MSSNNDSEADRLERMADVAAGDPHPTFQNLAVFWRAEAGAARREEQEKGRRK